MRKLAFGICENKEADQLSGNHEADQRLCFRYTYSTIPLLPKSEISKCSVCGTWSETPNTGFLTTRLIFKNILIHRYLYYLAVEMFTSDFGLRKKYFFYD